MKFSLRDAKNHLLSSLRSQAGQGIVEYILVLVVTIMLVLGALAQLNRGFREWADNYFGNYLACLLETGELPTISGSAGDSGICNQFFKAFTWQQGRPPMLQPAPPGAVSSSGGNSGGGERESGSLGAGGGYGNYTPVNRFGSGSRSSAGSGFGAGSRRRGYDSGNTGNTDAQSYGSDLDRTNRKLDTSTKERVDNGFAFENEAEGRQQRRGVASNAPRPSDESGKKRIIIHSKSLKKDKADGDDEGWTFGSFFRILIIAAIIIALVVLIGGQMLQVGKSME